MTISNEDWVNFSEVKPQREGYYYIRYLHKDGRDGQALYKAVWWNGEIFQYKDYVTEVYQYLPRAFPYYMPCQLWAETGEEIVPEWAVRGYSYKKRDGKWWCKKSQVWDWVQEVWSPEQPWKLCEEEK